MSLIDGPPGPDGGPGLPDVNGDGLPDGNLDPAAVQGNMDPAAVQGNLNSVNGDGVQGNLNGTAAVQGNMNPAGAAVDMFDPAADGQDVSGPNVARTLTFVAAGVGAAFLIALLLGRVWKTSPRSVNDAVATSNAPSPEAPPATTISGATSIDGGGATPTTAAAGPSVATGVARGSTATTAAPAGHAPTTAAPTSGSTPTSGPPGTTVPAPAPTMGALAANPGEIWESYSAKGSGAACQSSTTSKLDVTVTDPAGVESVTLVWSVNGLNGSFAMTRVGATDTFEGVLGSFKPGTVGKSGDTMALTARATDKGGRTSTTASKAFLHSAQECGAPA